MNIDELIRSAVRAELAAFEERMERRIQGEGRAQDLTTVPKAAKACGLHATTVREKYLPRIKKYGNGRTLRISIADLRAAMADDTGIDPDAVAERIHRSRRE